ncbi:POTRA domain-containing protein [Niabella aquatica]
MSIAQEDSTKTGKPDREKTPSPISPNSFNLDSLKKRTDDKVLFVRSISVEGNRFTSKSILMRELPFKEADSVHLYDLPEIFAQAKTQIMNTALFHRADVTVKDVDDGSIDVIITVKEKWYIYPIPYVKPIDRNLNEWLFKNGASIGRLDYGIKLNYDNLTRNNDKLRFYLVTGYTKQLLLSYSRPYIDDKMKWGANISLAVGKTHEINAITVHDKQVFVTDSIDYIRNFFRGFVEATYRPAFFTRHTFGFGFNTLKIGDSVIRANPNFLKNGNTQVSFPEFYYKLTYQNLDYIPYPTSGHAGELSVLKQGVNSRHNLWQLTAKLQGYWPLGSKTFYNISGLGTVKLPFRQPYYSLSLLGYGDMTLRGYESYVIDGVAGGMINATLFKQLTNFSFSLPFLKWLTDRLIPLKVYGKIYGNAGYVHNPWAGDNRLPNQMLFGGGIGFDLWTVNDFTFKFEFSFNQLGQNGLYLHKKTLF